MKLKRLIAGVISAAMMLSIGSTLAFAADVVYDEKGMTFDSVMYLSEDANGAPNVVYTYTIAAGDAEEFDYNGKTSSFIEGVTDGIVVTDNLIKDSEVVDDGNALTAQVEFSTSDTPVVDSDGETTVTKTVDFDFSDVTYSEAGVYVYTITEVSDPTADDTDGLLNESNSTRYVYVTVKNVGAATDGVCEIYNIIMTETAIETLTPDADDATTLVADATKSAGYIHSYGIAGTTVTTDPDDPKPDEPGTDGSQSKDFVITTTVKGDMANPNKDFAFATISANLGDELVGMEFTVVNGFDANGNGIESITVDENGKLEATFYMSSNDLDVSILGVVDGMVFTVSISDDAADGYAFYYRAYDEDYVAADVDAYANLNGWTSTEDSKVETFIVDTDYTKDDGVDFATVRGADDTTTLTEDDEQDPADDDLNIKYDAAFPETGVVLDLLPYVAMVAIAGAFIAFRIVKSARKDEE